MLASTPIGLFVFVLKLGVNPVLSGVQYAYKVAVPFTEYVAPAAYVVPEPFAAVFQPENA